MIRILHLTKKMKKIAKLIKYIIMLRALIIIINAFLKKELAKENNSPNAKTTNPGKMKIIVTIFN